MIISGANITAFELKVMEYTPKIELSINWFKMGNGSFDASDRGVNNDHITTEIDVLGVESYIDNIISNLYDNRISGDAILTLSEINAPIFGHHIDYTESVTVVLEAIGGKKQNSLKEFAVSLSFRAVNVSFKSFSLAFPDLSCVMSSAVSYTAQNFKISTSYNNQFSSGGVINSSTFDNDSGLFIGEYQLDYQEMGELLNYQRIQRAFPFNMPNVGKEYPFGILGGNTNLSGRLKEVNILNRISFNLFEVEIMIVQEF